MQRHVPLIGKLIILSVGLPVMASHSVLAQNAFSSGSTGADGPLGFAANSGAQVIDMTAKPDGVWNYTTIDIPVGVTVSFKKNATNTSVVWLAMGDVNIAGEISLDGASRDSNVDPGHEAPGGPGGFAGGLGGRRFDISGSFAGTPGQGPGGGAPGTTGPSTGQTFGQGGGSAGHRDADNSCETNNGYGIHGAAYGNQQLLGTLIGGSGGGGSASGAVVDGYNGSGGGGAMLIASSGNIVVNGSVHAFGGPGVGCGGSQDEGLGSGGSIRLVANRISGSGSLMARGGQKSCVQCPGSDGFIRTDAFFVQLMSESQPLHTAGAPLPLNLAAEGRISIVRIAGQVVQNPTGNTNSPDVVFSAAGDISIDLATTNIPPSTSITVRIAAAGQVITKVVTTDTAGKATATATVPAGVGTIQAFSQFVPAS